MVMLLFVGKLILFIGIALATKMVFVSVDLSNVVSEASQAFYGVALDTSLFTSEGLRMDIDLKSEKLRTLLGGLAPGYFRVGGTSANWLFYDIPSERLTSLRYVKANVITDSNFDDLVILTRESNFRLLYDLNANLRFGSEWNPSDAIRLFEYCKKKNYGSNIDWELGNEPNHGTPAQQEIFPPDQVAVDFINLSHLLKTYDIFKDSWLVGPDVGGGGLSYFKSVDAIAGKQLQAYTFHHYYFDGNRATIENYTDPNNFAKLEKLFTKIGEILEHSQTGNKPIWLGETSNGYRSGTRGVSDRYVSGFLSLDKLGYSAISNVTVVIRQTIFNGHYGLLNFKNFDPYPDYWLTWLHHELVGTRVFKADVFRSEKMPTIRIYAQCSKTLHYQEGAVTVFVINVHPTAVREVFFDWESNLVGPVDAYILKPFRGNLLSKHVLINDVLMKMVSDNEMPKLPRPDVMSSILIEPHRFGFFVFPHANAERCRQDDY